MEIPLTDGRSMTDLPKTGKITFAAYRPKTQLPVTCRPMPGKGGKLLTGQGEHGYFELLTPDEKAKLAFVFDYDTSYILEDGKVLDLDDPMDAAIWNWLKLSDYISLDKVSGMHSRDAAFYVVNPQKESRDYNDRTAKVDEARPAVRRLAETDRIRVADALGLDAAKTFPPDQVLTWLLRKADVDPQSVIDAINPENKGKVGATIFFKECFKWGVIERGKGGVLYFGGLETGVNVGYNEETVVSYLTDKANIERVRAMKNMLAERTKVKQPEDAEGLDKTAAALVNTI